MTRPSVPWGAPGPWRDRYEMLAVECRIAVLTRDAGPYVGDLFATVDRNGDRLPRPVVLDEDAAITLNSRRTRHYQDWDRKVRELQAELDIARQCHESEHLPPGTTFYVSVRRGEDHILLSGPYDTHEGALRRVPSARVVAHRVDARAFLYAYGTCSVAPGTAAELPFPDLHAEILNQTPTSRAAKGSKGKTIAAYTH